MPTSTANSNQKASLNKNDVFENDVHTKRDRLLKEIADDACFSSSSSKSDECAARNTFHIPSSSEFSTVKEPKNNFGKPKISTAMSLSEISAEWSSCEEDSAIKNGNSESVCASMENKCSNNRSDVTKELAAYQWSSVDEDGEKYFDIEIQSSTDEDSLDGKNKSEKETLVHQVRQRLLSTVQRIYSKQLTREKTGLHENHLNCENLQHVNIDFCFTCHIKILMTDYVNRLKPLQMEKNWSKIFQISKMAHLRDTGEIKIS